MARRKARAGADDVREFQVPAAFARDRHWSSNEGEHRPEGSVRRSYMVETNLGGMIENIAGIDRSRVMVGDLLNPGAARNRSTPVAEDHGPRRESAFGEGEEWTPVPDTSVVPWRSICHVHMRYHSAAATGTAWFVSRDTLITAGHNLLDPDHGWAEEVIVTPGKNGPDVGPWGAGYAVKGNVHPRWKASDGADLSADIAYLKINDPAVGQKLGWFGLRVMSDRELRNGNLIVHSAGYPADKPTGTQWVDASRIGNFSGSFIYYRLDTSRGNSGAPIFAFFQGGQRQVVASHSHGTADGTSNAGVRITEEIFRAIVGWIG